MGFNLAFKWLITLFSIYVLGNFHLSQILSRIRLRQMQDINPIPEGQGACPRYWYTL